MTHPLSKHRARIDEIDRELMRLFGERFNIVREVGHLKADENMNLKLFQKARVEEVLNNVTKLAREYNLSEERFRHIFIQLIDYAHEIEGHIKEDRL
mgnify:FL=1